ncbi:MAG: serine/threonine protein kinase [Myxococcales bacterium]|nr:serine/threonine protein kinase [Myxococcales bacterium]
MTENREHDSSTPEDPLLGRTLGERYEIVRRAGAGGMGRIYEARHTHLDRKVAIKVLSVDPLSPSRESFQERFFAEAKLTSRLSHPNTVRVLDYGNTDDIYYIAMEFIEGSTLRELLEQQTVLEPLRVVSLATQLCGSLAEAHDLGVIHRDLKPTNIMLTVHADGHEFVRVVDFGIAKPLVDSEVETQAGVLFGSPGYMSPEQILQQDLTPRSDLYGVGALLFLMLTGRRPFPTSSKSSPSLLHKHIHYDPPSFKTVHPEGRVPDCLEWVTRRCLEKDPDRRFASATELSRALRACELAIRGIVPSPLVLSLDAAGRVVFDEAVTAKLQATAVTGVVPPRSAVPTSSSAPQTLATRPDLDTGWSRQMTHPMVLVLGGILPLTVAILLALTALVIAAVAWYGIATTEPRELPAPSAPPAVPEQQAVPQPEVLPEPSAPLVDEPPAPPVAVDVPEPAVAPAPPTPTPEPSDAPLPPDELEEGMNDLVDPFGE